MFKELPSKFDFPSSEKEILALWEKRGIYEKSLLKNKDNPSFVFYEGPPTANGLPHPGHCLTRIVKDCFLRYKSMSGFNCQRKAGWDTHGLPVETEICKELGIHSKEEIEKYGVDKFVNLCQQSVFRYTKEWEELTKRLGFWINLPEAYVTYHQSYVESVWWALSELFKRGLLYQGHKVVWWWAQGGTALSSGEVGQGYRKVDDPSIVVRFRIKDELETSFLVWTTTPWTLLSNVALAVHPEVDYLLAEVENEKFIFAKNLISSIFGEKEINIIKEIKGRELEGKKYIPVFDYAFPENGKYYEVISDDFVSLDTGTGIVHIAPAFGEEDYKVAQKNNLGMLQLVASDGSFVTEVKEFSGRFCKSCDKDIIKTLKNNGYLFKQEIIQHEYPFCWRAEEDPLIQYARKSWFIRTSEFKEKLLNNNSKINWKPEHIKDGRFGNFLSNNVDWALSRERFWGTPLPIWQCSETGKQESISSYAELLNKPRVQGLEVWEKAKKENPELSEDLKIHKPYIDVITYDSPFSSGARMVRVPEVIDCWFDSGCMPFAQYGYPHQSNSKELFENNFPADFISEAIDQTRGWFYTLLSISTMLFNKEMPHPYKNCVVLGLICGEDGKKLSKSKRNYKDPSYIFDKEGADAMRWSMLSSQPPWNGAVFKESEIIDGQREFLIKLYNVYSFFVIYANIDKWKSNDSECKFSELDYWIQAELQSVISSVKGHMDNYDSYSACNELSKFIESLSNWYIRRSRERFWRTEMDADKNAAYSTLWSVLIEFSKVIAPFTPFFAESIYQNLAKKDKEFRESVHLCEFPKNNNELVNNGLTEDMFLVREISSLGLSARSSAKIKVRQPIESVNVILGKEDSERISKYTDLISDELNSKKVEFVSDVEKYTDYEIKIDFKVLGPKFGDLVPSIKQALLGANVEKLKKELVENGSIKLILQNKEIELASEDVQFILKPKEGWSAVQGTKAIVAISTIISPELKMEGIAREVIHLIQGIRKKKELDYQDLINMEIKTEEKTKESIERFKEYIMKETLCKNLALSDGLFFEYSERVDGEEILINIRKEE